MRPPRGATRDTRSYYNERRYEEDTRRGGPPSAHGYGGGVPPSNYYNDSLEAEKTRGGAMRGRGRAMPYNNSGDHEGGRGGRGGYPHYPPPTDYYGE